MAKLTLRPTELLIVLAREKLALTQRMFAEAIGTSVRTLSRWEAGRSSPAHFHYHAIAKIVHPVASDLAYEAALRGGTTLEELGLVAPVPPLQPRPEPVVAPAPAPPPPLPPHLLLDAVVCAVASALETLDGAPVPLARARAAVAAAFTSARALRLEIADAADALAPPLAPPLDHAASSRARSARPRREGARSKSPTSGVR